MNFITLPSGSLLNPVYISHVNREKDGVGIIIYTVHDEVFPESMSIEDFQNLLRGPAVTSP